MRKRLSILLIMLLLVPLLASCGKTAEENGGYRVVCTVFPLYDWTKNVLGEDADNLTLLIQNGTDAHSFQPSARDMANIVSADLLIYIGGESDKWIEEVLDGAGAENVEALCLMEALGEKAVAEEWTEGMEGEAEEDAMDEHIWLSLENALLCTDAIRDALCALNRKQSDVYGANAAAYRENLQALRELYKKSVDESPRDTLLFPDRFPFRYLTEECGLDYYAAFPGCSAESEASFDTVIFLAEKADELSLDVLLVSESADGRLAKTVMDSMKKKDVRTLTLDSMQSVTQRMIDDGYNYLDVMEANLTVLKSALEGRE